MKTKKTESGQNGPKILLIDLETAPNIVYVWSLFDNQNISIDKIVESGYILCYAARWLGEKEIIFDSIKKSGKEKMIKGAWKLIDEADAIVTYNGLSFDSPTLNREFLEIGLAPPSPIKHIDMYHVVKRNFRFPSHKLDYVCQALGIGAKVPHKGMDLWKGCMSGNKKDWKVMKEYNEGDVIILEKLYYKLLPWISTHPNFALYMNENRPVCTNCGSKNLQRRGVARTQLRAYPRFQCISCGKWMKGRIAERAPKNAMSGVNS